MERKGHCGDNDVYNSTKFWKQFHEIKQKEKCIYNYIRANDYSNKNCLGKKKERKKARSYTKAIS